MCLLLNDILYNSILVIMDIISFTRSNHYNCNINVTLYIGSINYTMLILKYLVQRLCNDEFTLSLGMAGELMSSIITG